MSSMNHVILLGGLTRDPELRHTSGGVAVAKFSLAVSEKYKDQKGELKESTCYIDIDAWGKLGELCAEFLRRRSQALVQGKLQMEKWTAKDGTNRTKLSVRAYDVQFLNRANAAGDNEFVDADTSSEKTDGSGQRQGQSQDLEDDFDTDPPF